MSILSKISKISFGLLSTAILVVAVMPLPQAQAIEFTTESQLVDRLGAELKGSSSLNSGAQVLGSATTVPFFPRGFMYPIEALGNCNSKAQCFEYCEDSANLEICAMVSYRNGSMNADQLKKTLAFSQYIKSGYIAHCDDLNSCAKLCDLEDAQEECALLADNMQSGSMVLGAQDNAADSGQLSSVLQKCTSFQDCNSVVSNTTNASSVLESLIASGQAPAGCDSAMGCIDYCSKSQSSACTKLYQSVASLSGGLDAFNTGRVLSVSSEIPIDIPIDNPPIDPPPPYEPTNYLNCVINAQGTIPTTTADAVQFDQFTEVTNQCGQQFSPSEGGASMYSGAGQQAVGNSISAIQSCILGMRELSNINSCLNQ